MNCVLGWGHSSILHTLGVKHIVLKTRKYLQHYLCQHGNNANQF